MERHHSNNSNGSNDSAYYSVVSQLSEDVHFPERSLAMSYSAGSPVPLCEGDNLSNTQYYNRQYLESNPPLQDSDSDRGNLYRPTPTSLKWLDTDLLSLYKFVVPKGKEPYFELLPSYFVSSETPEIVYLDHPRYAYLLILVKDMLTPPLETLRRTHSHASIRVVTRRYSSGPLISNDTSGTSTQILIRKSNIYVIILPARK